MSTENAKAMELRHLARQFDLIDSQESDWESRRLDAMNGVVDAEAIVEAIDYDYRTDQNGRAAAEVLIGALCKDLSALLAALPALKREESAWRTMEGAPKDGNPVDLWFGDHRAPDAWWGRPHHECGEAGQHCDCHPSYDGWCDYLGYLTGEEGTEESEPTHWMPLPTPPQASGAETEQREAK